MKSRRNERVEDKNLQTLKDLQRQECNKRCFECDQRGPTYVDVTIGSFVCTSCGGVLRGINPPHRVKSISMATFTSSEISLIQSRGNEMCKNIYLGKYDERSKAKPESRSEHTKLKMFMEQKYEQKRLYVPPEKVEKPKPQSAADQSAKKDAGSVKPLSSVVKNPVSIQVGKKPPARPPAPSVANILDGFDSPVTATTQKKSSAPAMPEFADFGNAFSTPATSSTFDAFADFSSAPEAKPNQAPLFDAFSSPQSNSSLQAPVSATAAAPVQKPKDKYADLGDLFNTEATSTADATPDSNTTSWGSVFMTPVSSNAGYSSSGSVFSNNSQATSVFGSNSAQPAQATSVFQSSPQAFPSNQQQSAVFTQSAQPQPFSSQANLFPMPQQQNSFSNTGLFQQATASATSNSSQNPFNSQPTYMNGSAPQQNAFVSSSNAFTQSQNAFASSNTFTQSTMKPVSTQQFSSHTFSNMQQAPPVATQNSSNPFFQLHSSSGVPAAAVQAPASNTAISNPFLVPQQQSGGGWNNQFTTPVPNNNSMSTTNPFTANVQQRQVSTNPFF